MNRESTAPALIGVALAFLLWHVVFVVRPGNFFLLMGSSTALLMLLAVAAGAKPHRSDLTLQHVLGGLGAALLLYLIFLAGNEALKLARSWLGLFPDRSQRLESVYATRGSFSPLLTGLLLLFPIGLGEELFWRGLVQQRLGARLGRWPGLFLTAALYAAVHLSSGNPVLVLAALACGLFWGGLYAWTGSLVLVLVSHLVWDPLIFLLFPIR
jgi:uncharacterized protein